MLWSNKIRESCFSFSLQEINLLIQIYCNQLSPFLNPPRLASVRKMFRRQAPSCNLGSKNINPRFYPWLQTKAVFVIN